MIWRACLLALFFWFVLILCASQCSAQTTFVRDQINTTRFTVLGSEKLFFSTDSTAPAVGYIKLWARDSTTLYLIRSSGVKVNLLASAVDTSVLATQYDISLKSAAFGTIDTSGLAVNKILKWNGSAWIVRNDSVGSGGASDSTTWIATDYDVSLKLNKADTLSLSNRINTKLTATDTLSLSNRINGKADSSALFFYDTLTALATSFDISTKADTNNVLYMYDTLVTLASIYDVSLKLNTAAIDTSAVLFWPDTVSVIATAFDLTTKADTNNVVYFYDTLTRLATFYDLTTKADTSNVVYMYDTLTSLATSYDISTKADTSNVVYMYDTLTTLATAFDISTKLNSAAIDTSAVLFWPDTVSTIATAYDLPVYRLDTVTAALDTLLVTVGSVTRVVASVSGTGTSPPIPVRAYVKDGTHYVLKFDYDLTANQPIEVTYWR